MTRSFASREPRSSTCAHLVEIPDAGHRFLVDAPARTVAALRAFFDAP